MTENKNLRIVPLGGVEEIGINCTVVEYHKQILVIDMGLGFPDESMYGVDYLVPNIDYLINRKDNIEGLVITHGHLDHIGALPYLLPKIDFPDIWGTEFTIELIKEKLKEAGILDQAKLHVINNESHLASGEFQVQFFRVNHSIPQCVGVVIDTPAGRVVHTGDFKFDNSPVNEPVADYARIAELGTQGVDILLSDSTNSLKKGHPVSESEVAANLKAAIEEAPGRVIIASFSGLVGRLYQLVQIASQVGRKVAIAGYSMRKTFEIAEKIGYINPPKDTIIPFKNINRYQDENVMILTTGSQGEENAALARMAEDGYKNVEIKDGDTVVISAGTIPGNNAAVQNLIDNIVAKGASVHDSDSLDFFTSGHGYQEDQKIMLNLVKPKYFMPVHGYQYFLKEHANTAIKVGIERRHIIIPRRGGIIEGNKHDGFKSVGSTKNTPLLVSGHGVGDVGTAVLKERHQLGSYGVLVINLFLDKQKQELAKDVEIITKGFVYVKSSGDILREIAKISEEEIRTSFKRGYGPKRMAEQIESSVRKYVTKEIAREPMILPVINVID